MRIISFLLGIVLMVLGAIIMPLLWVACAMNFVFGYMDFNQTMQLTVVFLIISVAGIVMLGTVAALDKGE